MTYWYPKGNDRTTDKNNRILSDMRLLPALVVSHFVNV